MNKAVMGGVVIVALLTGWSVLHAANPDEESATKDTPLRDWLLEQFEVRSIGKDRSAAVLDRFGADPKKAIPALAAALEDKDEIVRLGAATCLSYYYKADVKLARPLLLKALRDDKSSEVREAAVEALPATSLEDKAVVAALLKALKEDKAMGVRTEIVCKFREIKGIEATTTVLPAVIDALKDGEAAVRIQAAYAVAELGGSKTPIAIPLLISALKDKDDFVRSAAVYSLGKLCPDAIPSLRQALQDKNPVVRAAAVEALGKTEDKVRPLVLKELPAITPLLDDKESDVREHAARTLGTIKAVAAVPNLVAKLDDADAGVRLECIGALDEIGPEAAAAVEKLIKLLKDPDPWLRYATARALGSIGPKAKAAVPALIDALQDELAVRCQAAEALGNIGSGAKAAVPALKEALKTDDEQLQRKVEEALKLIGVK